MIRSSNRLICCVALLAGAVLVPAQARADAIVFQGMGPKSVVYIGGSETTNYHGGAYAGEMNWQWSPTAPDGFAQSFYAYCVDLAHFETPIQETVVKSSNGFTNGVEGGGAKAAWLFNEYAAGIHASANGVQSAALQVAIWESMYDSSQDLAAGAFALTGSSLTSAVKDQADVYLAALYAAPYSTSVATILDAVAWGPFAAGQDQITSATRVGEPSTLILMGLAFLGFSRFVRRSAPAY